MSPVSVLLDSFGGNIFQLITITWFSMSNDGGSLDANNFRWHIVWIALSAIIVISIPATLKAHSASTRFVLGLPEKRPLKATYLKVFL